MKEILQYPNPILLEKSSLVEEDRIKLAKMLFDAYEALPNNKVGLAAPQIGINKNAAIILGAVIFNLSFEPARQVDIREEACFSLNHAKDSFQVERPKYGWASWEDSQGELHEIKLSGLLARVFQHELDHINGKLCNQ